MSTSNHIEKVLDYLKNIISEHQYHKICFLGNSMGGYAAILFGTILDIDVVIAFAPQTYIDKWTRLKHIDTRWKKELREVYKFKQKQKQYFNLKDFLLKHPVKNTSINLFYSPQHRLDKSHANELKNIKQMHLIPIEKGGHAIVKEVRDRGQLKKLIKDAFNIP